MSEARGKMGVKQYVGRVTGKRGSFRVFETGDSKFYLFSQVDEYDCDIGRIFLVRKAELRDEVKWALAHAFSFDALAFERFIAAGGKMRRGKPILPEGLSPEPARRSVRYEVVDGAA
jgi:hypothetical protein